MNKISASCGTIRCNHQTWLTPLVVELYSAYNHDVLVPDFGLKETEEMETLVCNKIGMTHEPIVIEQLSDVCIPVVDNDRKAVVLGFSGGLDSVYQAIDLKTCVQRRSSEGGTSVESVKKQLAYLEEKL